MRESDCRAALTAYFRREGFRLEPETRHGWDIIARSDDIAWFIEVKGGDYRNSASYDVDFHTAIGQVASRVTMFRDNVRYGVAIPYPDIIRPGSFSYRSVLKRYSSSLFWASMKTWLILVKEDCDPEFCPPDQVIRYLAGL